MTFIGLGPARPRNAITAVLPRFDRSSVFMSHTPSRRRRSPLRILLLLLSVAVILAGVYRILVQKPSVEAADLTEAPSQNAQSSQAAQASAGTQADPMERKTDFFTILVSGVDDGNGGSDTNILVGFDAGSGSISCASVPRDTRAVIDGKSHKINYAYNRGGTELLADTLSDMLGIPVDFTVKVDLTGFIKLVDAIGGVDFDVPVNMDYDDPYQDLHVHFRKGMQHLPGEEAMEVVRFRENNDGTGYGTQDIGRMQTQQAFLKAVAKQTLTVANADKISQFARIFQDYVETDLTLANLAWLGKEAISIGADNISLHPARKVAESLHLSGSGQNSGAGQYRAESLCGRADPVGSPPCLLTACGAPQRPAFWFFLGWHGIVYIGRFLAV